MGKVIDLKDKFRELIVDNIVNFIYNKDSEADEIADSYHQLMIENPKSAIEKLPEYIDKTRDVNSNRAFVESVAEGPYHKWTAGIFNVLGESYSSLNRDLREEGLFQCVNILDKFNYFNSQDNVELINEPWLVADIIINRPLYWCGFKQYCDLLEENPKWDDFSQHIDSAKSEFWLAFSVIRPECSSLEIRSEFYKQFPDLIDRTKDAVGAICYNEAQHNNEKDGINIEDHIDKLLTYVDPLFYNDIKDKIEEKKWIKL